jgi:NAD(P)-dependent dehydrogenase (short-subunit alcohol dehydrogenase family)
MSRFNSTILITGGTTGLGYAAAETIAKGNPDSLVIIASRSSADNADETLNKSIGQHNVKYLPLDLSTLASVRKFASSYELNEYPKISVLLLNAGIQFPGEIGFSDDGFEKTFQTNHLSHALLFYLLSPHLTTSARIVITSSGTHDPKQKSGLPDAEYISAANVAKPDPATATKDGRLWYSTSKLCNILWTYALYDHIQSAGKAWTVAAFDPGLMPGTGLARDYSWVMRFLWNHVLTRIKPLLKLLFKTDNVHTAKESGDALAKLATDPEEEFKSGTYWEGLKEIRSSDDSYVKEKQMDLWEWTAKTVARNETEAQRFIHLN